MHAVWRNEGRKFASPDYFEVYRTLAFIQYSCASLCSARDSYQIQDRTRGNQSDNPHHAPIEHIYHMAISGYTGRMVKKQIR